MSGAPSVKITIIGEDDTSAETYESSLYMTYVQAVKGDRRKQYVVFPPGNKKLGVKNPTDEMIVLSREQTFAGNRSKWFHTKTKVEARFVPAHLENLAADGFTVGGVVVVPLEVDDYLSVWEGETPHKALRAVGRALEPLGITIK